MGNFISKLFCQIQNFYGKLVIVALVVAHDGCELHGQTTIPMEYSGGVYLVPCKLNGLPLKFVFDTGASDVSLSLTEALFMLKNGYLTPADFSGKQQYRVANGEIEEGYTLTIRILEIGGILLRDIPAVIMANMNSPLLLGQSALRELGHFRFDYESQSLIIGSESPKTELNDFERALMEVLRNSKQKYTLNLDDGVTYFGELENGVIHGSGEMTWPNGKIASGRWINGSFVSGQMDLPDGTRMKGDFKNGEIVFGHVMRPTRSIEYGYFVKGVLQGQGRITYTEDSVIEGIFDKGILIREVDTDLDEPIPVFIRRF